MNVDEPSLLFMFFLANTLTMNNSFNKKDRMCSDRKAGNCDRQKKNEAKQPGDVSSLLGFALIYIQSSTPFHTGPSFKKQHICPDFEVMDELSSAMHGNESCYFLLTPCIHWVLEITNHMVPRNYIIVNMNSLIFIFKIHFMLLER